VERRHDGGDKQWGLELNVRATEGVMELKREGKRGGEGGVLLTFCIAGREAEVAGIGGAVTVNGVLNGAFTGVKWGRKCSCVKGGNEGLDRSGPLHGTVAMARRHVRRRRRSTGAGKGRRGRPVGPGGPKCRVSRLAAMPIGLEAEKNPFGVKIRFLNLSRL
jgi:hypothetical protein